VYVRAALRAIATGLAAATAVFAISRGSNAAVLFSNYFCGDSDGAKACIDCGDLWRATATTPQQPQHSDSSTAGRVTEEQYLQQEYGKSTERATNIRLAME
jgi:hypothetical protein